MRSEDFVKKKKKRKGRKETRNFKSYRRIALMKINSLEPIPGNVSNIVSKLALSFWKRGGKRRKEERKKKKRMKKEKKKIGIVWKTRASKVPVGVVGLLMQ